MDNRSFVTRFEAYLLTEKCVSRNTFSAYKCDVEQLVSFLDKEHVAIKKITLKNLQSFLAHLHALDISARSVVRKISSLKIFFAYLNERFNVKNMTVKLCFPKVEKKLPRYLTEREMETLFEVVGRDSSPKGIRNKAMLYLLYVTGMRISELIALCVSDIQFDTGFVSVHGKGGKQRLIPIPKRVVTIIRDYVDSNYRTKIMTRKGNQSNYLFPIKYGTTIKPISRQAFWSLLKELWKKTGSKKKISPHKLRHSFATHMLKNGADLRSLQLLLGHENLSTVQIYTHVEMSYIRKVYDKKHPRS